MSFNSKFKKVGSSLVLSGIGLGCALNNAGSVVSANGKLAWLFFFLKSLIFGAEIDNSAENKDKKKAENKIFENNGGNAAEENGTKIFKKLFARTFMKNLKAANLNQNDVSFNEKEELERLFSFLNKNDRELGLTNAKFNMSKKELIKVVRGEDIDKLKEVLGDINEDVVLEVKGKYFIRKSGALSFKVKEKGSERHWRSLETFKTESFKSVKSCVGFINSIFERLRKDNKWTGKLRLLVEKDGVHLVRYDKKGCIVKKVALRDLEKSSFLDDVFVIRHNVNEDTGAFESLFFRSEEVAYHYNNTRNVFANIGINGRVLGFRDTVLRLKKSELKNILGSRHVEYVQEDGIDLSKEDGDVDIKLGSVFDNGFMTLEVKEADSSEWSKHSFTTKYATCDVDKIVSFFNYVFERSSNQKSLPYVYKLRAAKNKSNVYLAKYDVRTDKKIGEIEIGGNVVDVSDNAGYKVREFVNKTSNVA